MNLEPFFRAIEALPLATAISESALAFPVIETLHVIALVCVVSSIAVVDLRLTGVRMGGMGVDELINRLLPATWIGFLAAAITGALLFVSHAHLYAANPAFLIKFALLGVAGLNMLVFHLGAHKQLADLDPETLPPPAARAAGMTSLLLWTGIVFAGRWIGFV